MDSHWSEDVQPTKLVPSQYAQALDLARLSHSQLNVLTDIVVFGGNPGRELVHGLLAKAKKLLPRLLSRIEAGDLGPEFVQRTKELVREIGFMAQK